MPATINSEAMGLIHCASLLAGGAMNAATVPAQGPQSMSRVFAEALKIVTHAYLDTCASLEGSTDTPD